MFRALGRLLGGKAEPKYDKYPWYEAYRQLRHLSLHDDFDKVRFECYGVLGDVPVEVYRQLDAEFDDCIKYAWSDLSLVPRVVRDVKDPQAAKRLRREDFDAVVEDERQRMLRASLRLRINYRLRRMIDVLVQVDRIEMEAAEASLKVILSQTSVEDLTFEAQRYQDYLGTLGARPPEEMDAWEFRKTCESEPDAEVLKRYKRVLAALAILNAEQKSLLCELQAADNSYEALMQSRDKQQQSQADERSRLMTEVDALRAQKAIEPELPPEEVPPSQEILLKAMRVREAEFQAIYDRLKKEAKYSAHSISEQKLAQEAGRLFARWLADNAQFDLADPD
ncbi:MAG: hypothetical protein KDA91_11095 [Planctomycetaceae bacterium]|nr:hypothetical protein [Planctomycetaceae bacterium]